MRWRLVLVAVLLLLLAGSATAANAPPNASFAAKATGLKVAVNATASSDSDGSVVSYVWSWGDGSEDGTGRLTTHVYANAGTYTISLTVRDNGGAADSATRTVSVANAKPTASLSVAKEGLRVTLNASASSDPDGTLQVYSWDFGDGNTGTGRERDHVYGAPGNYSVFLTVRDDKGATDDARRNVTVVNVRPRANFTFTVTDLRLRADASVSDARDDAIVSYNWTWGDGNSSRSATPIGIHTYAVKGRYVVSLRVEDGHGASDEFARPVTVNARPVAKMGVEINGLTVRVDSNGTHDPDGTEVDVTIHWGDGSTPTNERAANHSYAAAGKYRIRVVAKSDGSSDTAERNVTITPNKPPTASFTTSVSGLKVTADGGGSKDPEGGALTYSWTFGDGATGRGAVTDHFYSEPGTYRVVLTVTDPGGATAVAEREVRVAESAGGGIPGGPPGAGLAGIAAVAWLAARRSTIRRHPEL